MTESGEERGVRRSILIGTEDVLVTDPFLVEPKVAEVFVDVRVVDGWAAITLGAYSREGGPPEVRVTTRLRMPLVLLGGIHAAVEQQLAAIAQAKQAAN